MTIGEQNNKNIMGLMDQIQSLKVTPYESPMIKCEKCGDKYADDGDDWCPHCRRQYAIQSITHEPQEPDEDLLFEQARELKRGNE